jgi:nicotinamidase/pyrazinamidase
MLVDVQRDFLPGGALAVPHGDAVLAPLNRLLQAFAALGLPVIATRDWHPPDHCSFRAQGGPWPVHCVAESEGARFPDALLLPAHALIVSKAETPGLDAYSGFTGTRLADELGRMGAVRLFIGGLATDYCVLHTVLDALAFGYLVVVLRDGIAAVDVRAGDGDRALARMKGAGARVASSTAIARRSQAGMASQPRALRRWHAESERRGRP